eukprot:3560620-Rhodomonas_salina.1
MWCVTHQALCNRAGMVGAAELEGIVRVQLKCFAQRAMVPFQPSPGMPASCLIGVACVCVCGMVLTVLMVVVVVVLL